MVELTPKLCSGTTASRSGELQIPKWPSSVAHECPATLYSAVIDAGLLETSRAQTKCGPRSLYPSNPDSSYTSTCKCSGNICHVFPPWHGPRHPSSLDKPCVPRRRTHCLPDVVHTRTHSQRLHRSQSTACVSIWYSQQDFVSRHDELWRYFRRTRRWFPCRPRSLRCRPNLCLVCHLGQGGCCCHSIC